MSMFKKIAVCLAAIMLIVMVLPVLGSETPVVSVSFMWGGQPNNLNGPFQEWLAENYGFKLKIIPIEGDSQQQYALWASAHQLPDIFNFYSDAAYHIANGQKGMAIPLNKYFNDAKNYPNIAGVPMMVRSRYMDGKGTFWSVPGGNTYNPETPPLQAVKDSFGRWCWYPKYLIDGYRSYARKSADWFPTYTEEWIKYTEWACKQKTPDGKPVYAGIPLEGHDGIGMAQLMQSFSMPAGAWDLPICFDTKGQPTPAVITKQVYNAYRQGARWYRKKITDPEMWSITRDGFEAKMFAGQYASMDGCDLSRYNGVANEKMVTPEIGPCPVPRIAPENQMLVGWRSAMGWNGMQISGDCKTPDLAAKALDWLTSPEGGIAIKMGIPDVDWKWTKPPVHGGDVIVTVLEHGKQFVQGFGTSSDECEKNAWAYGINARPFSAFTFNGNSADISNMPKSGQAAIQEAAYEKYKDTPLKYTCGQECPTWQNVSVADPKYNDYANELKDKFYQMLGFKLYNTKNDIEFDKVYKQMLKQFLPQLKKTIQMKKVDYDKMIALKMGFEKYTKGMGSYETVIPWDPFGK